MKSKFYVLKINLERCHVEVTRTIVVPSDLRLDYLHEIIQDVMGWQNSHLHEFKTKNKRYGMKIEDYDKYLLNERRVRLCNIVKPQHPRFVYIYDSGDEWVHSIEVIDFDYTDLPPRRKLYCLDAKGSCPPEDVGGVWGYKDFCRIINDPEDPEHEEMLEWVHDGFSYIPRETWPDMASFQWIDELLKANEVGLRRVTAAKKPKPRKIWVYCGN